MNVAINKLPSFLQTLIQGDEGNIIVAGLNDETPFVGLTPSEVNPGIAEVRTMTAGLTEIL